jgi:hypothetical protein
VVTEGPLAGAAGALGFGFGGAGLRFGLTDFAFGLRTTLAAGRFPFADFEDTARFFDRFIPFFIHPSFGYWPR